MTLKLIKAVKLKNKYNDCAKSFDRNEHISAK